MVRVALCFAAAVALSACAAKQKSPPEQQPAAEPPPPHCVSTPDCPPGLVCEGGAGCDKTWACVPQRPCTRDLVAFCGCDGQTFFASSTCPGRRYAHLGTCSDAPGAVPQ